MVFSIKILKESLADKGDLADLAQIKLIFLASRKLHISRLFPK